MRSSAIAAAVLVTLLAAASARAQTAQASPSPTGEPPAPDAAPETVELEEPEPTQGHFIALGFHGIGAMAFDADRGTRDPTLGQAVSLRLGESVTDWLTLSLAFAIGSTSGEPRDSLTLGRFGITSQWYFTDRWFIQAGFGALYAQGPDPEDHDISDGTQSGGWVLTPMLSADVGPDSDFTTTSLSIGIELSYWTGLARDKLKLPTPKAYAK
jgi:hypothetical protein